MRPGCSDISCRETRPDHIIIIKKSIFFLRTPRLCYRLYFPIVLQSVVHRVKMSVPRIFLVGNLKVDPGGAKTPCGPEAIKGARLHCHCTATAAALPLNTASSYLKSGLMASEGKIQLQMSNVYITTQVADTGLSPTLRPQASSVGEGGYNGIHGLERGDLSSQDMAVEAGLSIPKVQQEEECALRSSAGTWARFQTR